MDQVFSHADVVESLQRVAASLAAVVDQVHHSVIAWPGKLAVHTRLQALFNLKFGLAVDRAVYEVIATHGIAAEKLGPGGFVRCVQLLLPQLRGVPVSAQQQRAHAASAADVDRLISASTATVDAMTAALLRRAVLLAGFGGCIILEKTPSIRPSIELVRGYTFDLQPLLQVDASFVSPRAFCIDGYIEDVSEVHHLLEAAAEAHEPCVVFLRGLSDDVRHTLKVNYDRGSLRVLPLGVPFDLDGMNTLVDLSVIAGCDLVSSLKGDLISSIDFHAAPRIDQLTVHHGRTVVSNSPTHRRVSGHVAELRARRRDESVDDKGTLLDKRIRSLSPNHVVVRLPDDKDFVVRSQAIDYALRTIKSAVDHGIAADGRLVATELAAAVHAERCVRTLLQLGGVVSRGS